MLTTIEAEIDVNGKVTFLEPLKIIKKRRAIITLLDDEKPMKQTKQKNEIKKVKNDVNFRQLEWLKANREKYAGKYVALDGDILVAHAETLPEIREQVKNRTNIFIVKVFAEETIVSAGL